MDFGSAGFKGNGKGRSLELPDGLDASEAPLGRARLRYNDLAGQLELSINQGPYLPFTAGGGAIPLNGISWVDGRNGNDVTAVYGSQNNPFQTVQAAVNSAIASGFTTIGIVILGGDYPEDVVIPNVTVDTRIGFVGLGGVGVNVRSIEVVAPTAAPVDLEVSISLMSLGERAAGGQTVAPLRVVGGTGLVLVETQDTNFFSSTPGIPPVQTANAAATGVLSLRLGEGQALCTNTASPAAAMVLEYGEVFVRGFDAQAVDASAVDITGPAVFTGYDLVARTVGVGGNPIISHTGVTGQVNLISSVVVPALTTDDVMVATNPGVSCATRSFIVGAAPYTGQIVLGGGPIFYNFMADTGGTAITVVGAGSETLLQNTSQVQHDSPTALGGQPALNALDDVFFGTTQVSAPIVGPGTFALGDDATILVDTGAAVTLTLPAVTSRPRGKAYRIVDVTGGGSSITINPTGGDTVDGGGSLVFTPAGANASIVLQSESAATNWALTQADPTGGSGAAIPLDRVAFVNQLNGNDGTAVFGDIALPYQTVQAAVTDAVNSGFDRAGLIIGPGEYAEDVVVPASTINMDLGITASSGPGSVAVRGMQINAPGAGITMTVGIESMQFGDSSGAQAQFPLDIRGAAGDLFVTVYDTLVLSSTSFIDPYFQQLSTGILQVRTFDSSFVTTTGAVDTAAVTVDGGLFYAENATIRGGGFFSTIQSFVGNTDMELKNSEITRTFDPSIPIFDISTPGRILVSDSRIIPVAANNQLMSSNNAGMDVTMRNVLLEVTGYTSNISMAPGSTFSAQGLTTADGAAIPVLNAVQVPLEQSSQVRFTSAGVLGTTTVEAAITALSEGQSEISAPIVGPGTFALGGDETVLVDTGAAVTLTLPAITATNRGKKYRIVDVTNGGNNITINPTGADTVDGGATFTLPAGLNASAMLQAETALTNWAVTQAAISAGGGAASFPLNTISYVNPLNGNDGTGVHGDINLPFQTVQAAVTAALTVLPNQQNFAVAIAPGSYEEDVFVDFTLNGAGGVLMGIFGQNGAVKLRGLRVLGPNVAAISGGYKLFLTDFCIGPNLFHTVPGLRIEGGTGTAGLTVVAENFAVELPVFGSLLNVMEMAGSTAGPLTFMASDGYAINTNFDVFDSGSALLLQHGTFRGTNFDLQGGNAPAVILDGAVEFISESSEIRQIDSFGTSPLIESTAAVAHSAFLSDARMFPTDDTVDLVSASNPTLDLTFNDCIVTRPTYTGQVDLGPGGQVNVTSLSVLGGGPIAIAGATVNLQHNASQVQYSSTTVLGNRDAGDAITQLVQGVSETPAVFLGPGTVAVGTNGVLLVDTTQPITFNLPVIATVPAGRRYRFVDITNGGSNITVAANGAETINGAATLTITSGNRAEIISYPGSTDWAIIDS